MSRLDQLLADIFGDEAGSIHQDTVFAAVPGWDSLKHVELVVGIESRFGVDLSVDEIARITSKHTAREVLAARGCDD